jgi:hypothetical protein
MVRVVSDDVPRRRATRRREAATTPVTVRLARVVRADVAPARSTDDAAVVLEVAGLRVTIGPRADLGLVAMVVALLGAARPR